MTLPLTRTFRSYGIKLRVDLSFLFRKQPSYESICDVVLAAEAFVKSCAALKQVNIRFIDSHRGSKKGKARYIHKQVIYNQLSRQMWDMKRRLESLPIAAGNSALVVELTHFQPAEGAILPRMS